MYILYIVKLYVFCSARIAWMPVINEYRYTYTKKSFTHNQTIDMTQLFCIEQ